MREQQKARYYKTSRSCISLRLTGRGKCVMRRDEKGVSALGQGWAGGGEARVGKVSTGLECETIVM